jgi:DNA-binding GntR family transcriptional regulator
MPETEQSLPVELFLDFDRSGPVPLYYQVASKLEKAISDGTLSAGARLENEIALSHRLGLSRPTVRRAIQELVDKGLLVRRRGIGTQVVHGKVTRNVELTSLYEDLERAGQVPSTRLLFARVGPCAPEAAEALGIAPGVDVLHIRRLRTADDLPLALLDNTLPPDHTDIDVAALERHGLYQLLRARGVTMQVAKQRIGARASTREESELLDLSRGAPVLTMTRTVFDNSGRAVEYGDHCYRPDLYSFEVTVVNR